MFTRFGRKHLPLKYFNFKSKYQHNLLNILYVLFTIKHIEWKTNLRLIKMFKKIYRKQRIQLILIQNI